MATLRKVTVASTVGGRFEIETNATTFGELKPLLSDRGLNVNELTFVDGTTQTEFSINSAILPASDFQILSFPKKNKFGSIEEDLEYLVDKTESTQTTLNTLESKLNRILTLLESNRPVPTASTLNNEDELVRRARELERNMYNQD